MIPYGRQNISDEDIEAVVTTLKSDFITQGPAIIEFEKALTLYCGVKHGFAVNSATSALHMACLALGVGEGDVVWTSPNSFVASANCAIYCGAEIDFVDIDPVSYNISIVALADKLSYAEKSGRLPKVVIPVHFSGQSCEMDKIKQLSDKYGFRIIEDASHAIGGKYKNTPVGSCEYSDICVFSFHPVKIITTGEGGMVVTNNDDLAQKMTLSRSHGVTKDPSLMVGTYDGAWYYQQVDLGYNYRMTDIQASLGASQMKRLDSFIAKRHDIATKYANLLSDTGVILPKQHQDTYSSYHLYVIKFDMVKINKSKSQIFDELREAGIGVNVHYIPIHTQPYYQDIGFNIGDFPESEKYYQEAISIPMYPDLKDSEIEYVTDKVRCIIS